MLHRVLTIVLAGALGLAVATPADADEAPVLTVSGVVVQIGDGPASGDVQIVAGNSVIPVDAEAVAGIESGTAVEASLAIPAEVVDELDVTRDVPAETALGAAIIEAADAPLEAVSVDAVDLAAVTTTGIHYLDVAINTSSGGAAVPSDADVKAQIKLASDFFVANTDGAFPGFSVRSIKRYASALPCGNTKTSWDWARDAATRFGRQLDDYFGGSRMHVVLIGECMTESKAAVGSMGTGLGSGGFVSVQSNFFDRVPIDYLSGTIAHEFGHNFGLGHANAPSLSSCAYSSVPLYTDITSCSTANYGDEWSVMGFADPIAARPVLDIARKEQLRVLQPGTLVTHPDALKVTYNVGALNGTLPLKGVKVNAASGTYYVEYRDGTGESSAIYMRSSGCAGTWEPSATCTGKPYGPGVRIIRLMPGDETQVVAARTRADYPNFVEYAFDAGDTWQSSTGDVVVTVASTSAGSAKVSVTTGAGPAASVSAHLSAAPVLGASVSVIVDERAPSGAALSYQWRRNGTSIAGAIGASYLPNAADAGTELSVVVRASASGYTTAQVTASARVTPGAPTLNGKVRVAAPVVAVPGAWPAGFALSYQWRVAGVDVAGATSSTYVPKTVDQGKALEVLVTGTHATLGSATLKSAPAAVGLGILSTSVPKTTGTAVVGGSLRAWPGVWTPGTSLSYRWYANGVAISGATTATYRVPSSMAAKKITVRVTGKRTAYSASTEVSASVGVPRVATPAIKGTSKVGSWLVASPGTWTTNSTFTYQWYANGYKIVGATGSKYKAATAQVGKVITVKVTGSKPGYTTVTRTSAKTAKVSR